MPHIDVKPHTLAQGADDIRACLSRLEGLYGEMTGYVSNLKDSWNAGAGGESWGAMQKRWHDTAHAAVIAGRNLQSVVDAAGDNYVQTDLGIARSFHF